MPMDSKVTQTYVLMTAARNEDAYIEKTLWAVAKQTILPRRWVIVNDNSTDQTRNIIESFQKDHPFIELINLSGNENRNFSSKVFAINMAYESLKNEPVDFIGVLDADISFDANYYEEVLKKFAANDRLGLAGGVRYDLVRREFHKVMIAHSSVGGPVQFFRKSVFDQLGGFLPIRYGGEDAVAEIMIRKLGWVGRSFNDIIVYHYRPTGSEGYSRFRSKYRDGMRFYIIGYHPLFYFARSFLRVLEEPILLGTFFYILGYLYAWIRLERPNFPEGYLSFLHSEQLGRLRGMLSKGRDILNQ